MSNKCVNLHPIQLAIPSPRGIYTYRPQNINKEGTQHMQTNVKCNLQPKQRPKLADEIAASLHTLPCYQKVPSLSYKIGDCTLERDGTLRIPDTVDSETVDRLLNHLQEKGFTGEIEQTEDILIITVPKNTFTEQALTNLQKMVDNKEALFSKAFVKENLTLNIDDDNVSFDWFQFTANPDEVSAYTEFVSRLCDLAGKVKRVVPTLPKTTMTTNTHLGVSC